MVFEKLRKNYHDRICKELIRRKRDGSAYYYNFADKSNTTSRNISEKLVELLCTKSIEINTPAYAIGTRFEQITCDFIEQAFLHLRHLRPGDWLFSSLPISEFDQYKHLADFEAIVRDHRELSSTLGTDYIVKPDIVVARRPVTDEEINLDAMLLADKNDIATHSPFRVASDSAGSPILHASISCKWTLRSDRSQNARTEALNLIRNRKGNLPHIVAVTAEPLPTRIASLALGTGDLDCVYHFALTELLNAIDALNNEDQMDMLATLKDGRRLRDISDLIFDLAV